MAPWQKGRRHESWASNPNIAVYIFCGLFVVWLAFQVWSRLPGGPSPPAGLDPMVMAALGVAISAKSVERKQQEKVEAYLLAETQQKVKALEETAAEAHPDVVAKHSPPLQEGGGDDAQH